MDAYVGINPFAVAHLGTSVSPLVSVQFRKGQLREFNSERADLLVAEKLVAWRRFGAGPIR